MVLLLAGASHTGKTLLAQRLLEKYRYPYLSIDHLKMGLIRSGQTRLTPEEDEPLTEYLWPVVREIAKTAVENGQNLVIEGCYIPFDWKDHFDAPYLKHIRYCCLVMTTRYIDAHMEDIRCYANAIERRLDDSSCTRELLIRENAANLESCKKYGCNFILIDDCYDVDLALE